MKKFLFTTLPSNDLGLLTRSIPIRFAPTTAEIWNMDHAAEIIENVVNHNISQKAPTGRFIVGRRPFFNWETREVWHVKRRNNVVFLRSIF